MWFLVTCYRFSGIQKSLETQITEAIECYKQNGQFWMISDKNDTKKIDQWWPVKQSIRKSCLSCKPNDMILYWDTR